jgi:spore maturation protein SpmA
MYFIQGVLPVIMGTIAARIVLEIVTMAAVTLVTVTVLHARMATPGYDATMVRNPYIYVCEE